MYWYKNIQISKVLKARTVRMEPRQRNYYQAQYAISATSVLIQLALCVFYAIQRALHALVQVQLRVQQAVLLCCEVSCDMLRQRKLRVLRQRNVYWF